MEALWEIDYSKGWLLAPEFWLGQRVSVRNGEGPIGTIAAIVFSKSGWPYYLVRWGVTIESLVRRQF